MRLAMTTKQRAVTAARLYLTYGAAPFDVVIEWNDDRIPADLIFDGDQFTTIAERQCLEDVRRHSPDLDNELIEVRNHIDIWSEQERKEELQWFWGCSSIRTTPYCPTTPPLLSSDHHATRR